jgi:hypothetical protein
MHLSYYFFIIIIGMCLLFSSDYTFYDMENDNCDTDMWIHQHSLMCVGLCKILQQKISLKFCDEGTLSNKHIFWIFSSIPFLVQTCNDSKLVVLLSSGKSMKSPLLGPLDEAYLYPKSVL